MLSALRAPTPKNANLLSDAGPVTPVVVYTGPTRTPAEVANLANLPEAVDTGKKKAKHKPAAKPADAKAAAAKSTDDKPAAAKPAAPKPATAKPAEKKPAAGKTTEAKPADGKPATSGAASGAWTPTSPSALAANPPPELGTKSRSPAAAIPQ